MIVKVTSKEKVLKQNQLLPIPTFIAPCPKTPKVVDSNLFLMFNISFSLFFPPQLFSLTYRPGCYVHSRTCCPFIKYVFFLPLTLKVHIHISCSIPIYTIGYNLKTFQQIYVLFPKPTLNLAKLFFFTKASFFLRTSLKLDSSIYQANIRLIDLQFLVSPSWCLNFSFSNLWKHAQFPNMTSCSSQFSIATSQKEL